MSGTRVFRTVQHIVAITCAHIINFNPIDTSPHNTATHVLTHVHIVKTFICTLYKLRDSLIGLHCCRSELHRLASDLRELYGTDNVISVRNMGNRMHFDHAACVIRAGEIGIFDLIKTSEKLKG